VCSHTCTSSGHTLGCWGVMLFRGGCDNGLGRHLLVAGGGSDAAPEGLLHHCNRQQRLHCQFLWSSATRYRSPFATFKHRWNEEMRMFTKNQARMNLERKQFFRVFTPVWQKSMTVELAQFGFCATGLFPRMRDIQPLSLSSEVTSNWKCSLLIQHGCVFLS